MAGDIFAKEGTVVTVTSTGGSTTTGTATSAGDIDIRSGGTTNLIQQLEAVAELTCQWGTTTGIVAGTIVADVYLVPKLDGTNAVDVDTTSGASFISSQHRVGTVTAHKGSLSTSTNYRFATRPFVLWPGLYTVYLLNKSGQTISANWTLKIGAARSQYS